MVFALCTSRKKTTTSKELAPVASAPASVGPPVLMAKSATGIYAPGEAELQAIHMRFSDVTMQTLQDGYLLYTGTCTGCHEAKSIYKREEGRWPGILDEMAPKSKLSPSQKDAVYKYVLAIKATQPK
jgi:cytochrome c1